MLTYLIIALGRLDGSATHGLGLPDHLLRSGLDLFLLRADAGADRSGFGLVNNVLLDLLDAGRRLVAGGGTLLSFHGEFRYHSGLFSDFGGGVDPIEWIAAGGSCVVVGHGIVVMCWFVSGGKLAVCHVFVLELLFEMMCDCFDSGYPRNAIASSIRTF